MKTLITKNDFLSAFAKLMFKGKEIGTEVAVFVGKARCSVPKETHRYYLQMINCKGCIFAQMIEQDCTGEKINGQHTYGTPVKINIGEDAERVLAEVDLGFEAFRKANKRFIKEVNKSLI